MLFVSKYKNLRLIKKPNDRVIDDQRRVIQVRGEIAEFTGGRYTTNDPEMIDWLLHHPMRGNSFVVLEDNEIKKIEEYNSQVRMTAGANATVDSNTPTTLVHEVTKVQDEEKLKSWVKDEISTAMKDILVAIKGLQEQSQVIPLEPRKKRLFTCPVEGCGETFTSGIAVGAHKKEKHPDLSV